MEPVLLQTDLLERLVDPADPALRARVLTDLLDRPTGDPDVIAARERVPEQPWVQATLAAYNGDGTWGRGFYHKYDGTSWVLLHLGEVGAPMDLPPIRAGIERLIATARPIGKMTGKRSKPFRDLHEGVYWEHPIACLTAHMALVLTRAGMADHPVTRHALDVCRHRFQPGLGFGCFVVEPSLIPACVMTVPKVLKAMLALPADRRTKQDRAFIDGMVDVLKKFHLYEYVPDDTAEWRDWSRGKSLVQIDAGKKKWIAEGRVEPRRPKEGWLRFSFPHSYNSDLLEVLLLLGEAGERRDSTIDAGLGIVASKRGRDGMWKMVGGLNGKMHADLDTKGKPSPWITYRALFAFKRFGLLELE